MSNDSDPAAGAVAVTPSDSVLIFPLLSNKAARGLYVGGAGTLSVLMSDTTTVSFTVPAGIVLPIKAQRVNATGTTASGIVALY